LLHAGHLHADDFEANVTETPVIDEPANRFGGNVFDGANQAAVAAPLNDAAGWTDIAPLPVPRIEAQAESKGGRLYVLGGFADDDLQATNRVDMYDPQEDRWTRVSRMPVAVTHAPTVVDGNNIILIGGYVGAWPGTATRDVWMFNTHNKRWASLPPLPQARAGGGAGIVGTKLYYYGGSSGSAGGGETDHANTWFLDLANQDLGWNRRASLPVPRNHIGYASLGGKLYAIGGQLLDFASTGNQTAVHSYNPKNNRWSEIAPLPIPLGHIHTSTIIDSGNIVVAGGLTEGRQSVSAVYVFYPQDNAWVLRGELPSPRNSTNVMIADGTIYIAGGGPGVNPESSAIKQPWNPPPRAADVPRVAAGSRSFDGIFDDPDFAIVAPGQLASVDILARF